MSGRDRLTPVVFALEDGSVEVFRRPPQHALTGGGGCEDRAVVPLSLLNRTGLVTQNVHQRSEEREINSKNEG